MRVQIDCYQCLVRQIAEVVKKSGVDENTGKEAILKTMELVAKSNIDETPPEIAERMYPFVHFLLKAKDVFKEEKNKANEEALKIYPEAKKMVETSSNPLSTSLKISVAGNIIDSSMSLNYEIQKLHEEAEKTEFVKNYEKDFISSLRNAKTLLLITDNAGEIVFDRLLVETIKKLYSEIRITVAVRGGSIINDATYEDALKVGMDKVADKLITTGFAYPGIPLRETNSEFVDAFFSSDVVLSKGQGNFESLSSPPRPVFYLFKAKCDVVCKYLGVPKESALFIKIG